MSTSEPTTEFEILEGPTEQSTTRGAFDQPQNLRARNQQRQTESPAPAQPVPITSEEIDMLMQQLLGIHAIQSVIDHPEGALNHWYWAYYLDIVGALVIGLILLPIGASDVFDPLLGTYPLLYLLIVFTVVSSFKALRILSPNTPATHAFRNSKAHVLLLLSLSALWFTIALVFLSFAQNCWSYQSSRWHRCDAFGRTFLRIFTTVICFIISAINILGATLLYVKSSKIADPPAPPPPRPRWESVDAVEGLPVGEGGIRLD
ncbi:hypothetical protein DL96DRAFT_1816377 [Flagelloscypha sp. PMI_526]|nr:hypothetical protein DL96DRAFT_1816377 [Flagelloscypha sp. PMI_526]